MIQKIKQKMCSFKVKITLWFSLTLIVLCMVLFLAVFLLYNYTQRIKIMENLTLTVDSYTDEFQNRGDLQDFFAFDMRQDSTSELFFYSEGCYLAIYDEQGKRCSGYFLSTEEDQIPFKDYQTNRAAIDGISCYVSDRKIETSKGSFWVRGIAYAEFGWELIWAVIKNIFYVVPIVLLIALFGGYFLARHFLQPIEQITKTAETISNSGNLSKRIPIRDNQDEIAQLAATFNKMFEKLEKNFEAEKEFTSNASHELRTPVAIIQAQCEYAIENITDPEELWEVVAAIEKQGYRMTKLLENLLILTRIEQKSELYPSKEENLSDIVRIACADWHANAEKNITLHSEIQPDVKRPVNGELFHLLFNNLLQNAYRYGRKNGNVYVRLYKEGDKAAVWVKDDGIGISTEDLPRIWERFYRVDKSRSKKGIGLGLSLVKQITEYYEGTITVSSEVDHGTEFYVKL